MIGNVVGTIDDNRKPVALRILGEVRTSDRLVLFEPVLWTKPLKGGSEFVIDLRPGTSKFGCRKRVSKNSVAVRDIRVIELWLEPFAETHHGKHMIVDCGQMAE
jgi:hypothetical protein